MENRKKGDVLLKASAEGRDARARAPISVLAMLSSTGGVDGRNDTKLSTMPAATLYAEDDPSTRSAYDALSQTFRRNASTAKNSQRHRVALSCTAPLDPGLAVDRTLVLGALPLVSIFDSSSLLSHSGSSR